MLISEEKVSYKEILEYDTKTELIAFITERKVLALSFKGLRELSEDLEEKYGVMIFSKAEDLDRAAILVEQRNLIVHNQGIVNQRYLNRVSSTTLKLGEALTLDHDYVFKEQLFLAEVVKGFNMRTLAKFIVPLLKKSQQSVVPETLQDPPEEPAPPSANPRSS